MNKPLFITASELAESLGVSRAQAYKIIKTLNMQLTAQGYMTLTGKVSRRYFEEKFYGMEVRDVG